LNFIGSFNHVISLTPDTFFQSDYANASASLPGGPSKKNKEIDGK